jgi:hypothetical protein
MMSLTGTFFLAAFLWLDFLFAVCCGRVDADDDSYAYLLLKVYLVRSIKLFGLSGLGVWLPLNIIKLPPCVGRWEFSYSHGLTLCLRLYACSHILPSGRSGSDSTCYSGCAMCSFFCICSVAVYFGIGLLLLVSSFF